MAVPSLSTDPPPACGSARSAARDVQVEGAARPVQHGRRDRPRRRCRVSPVAEVERRVAGGRASRARWRGGRPGAGRRRAGRAWPARSATVPSRSRASRVSSRAVTVVVAVDSRWSNQTPRCSRASCSTAAAWSGSHRSRASCSTGFSAGIRLCRPVTARCRSTNATAVARQAGGRPGDLAGLPRLQPAVLDQRPQPREPEAELDGLAAPARSPAA